MADSTAPKIEKETDLVEKWNKVTNRGYWGYHEGEEGDGDKEEGHGPSMMGCGAGG